MLNSGLDPRDFPLSLRAVMSAGEQLGRETYEWAHEAFGFRVNEFYGQTECNLVLGSCAAHRRQPSRRDRPAGARATGWRSSTRRVTPLPRRRPGRSPSGGPIR
jgi:acyl-coenzyme A synthetase/AMP-(fatty) acid ligase